jgi:aspartate carbamoyltransferase catalytic subunit
MPKHLISIKDLELSEIHEILAKAQYWSNRLVDGTLKPAAGVSALSKPVACNLFFEPSTRTRFSFELAMKRLDYLVMNFTEEFSSAKKGETFYDTIKTLESMGVDVAVVRTRDEHALDEIADKINLSLINAGTGANEHPTQALLDLLTIRQEFKEFNGLTVAIVGDIKHSRVAGSNLTALSKLGVQILFAGPEKLMRPPEELAKYPNVRVVDIDTAVKEADVVMMLRIQHERHNISYGEYHKEYGLTNERATKLQKHAIIMHPAPFNRGVEIDDDLIEAPQARIFKQVNNGVAVRMAVLDRAISED